MENTRYLQDIITNKIKILKLLEKYKTVRYNLLVYKHINTEKKSGVMHNRLQRGLLLKKPSVAYPSFRFGVAAVKAADEPASLRLLFHTD